MADTGTPTLRVGDFVWSPAGENEWCIVILSTNDATWQYVRPSTQTVIVAAVAQSALPPAQKRKGDYSFPPPPRPLTF